jgi:hypothetical protein
MITTKEHYIRLENVCKGRGSRHQCPYENDDFVNSYKSTIIGQKSRELWDRSQNQESKLGVALAPEL